MLASFCLRLAWGLIVSTLILPRSIVPPRFFRVQYLTSLGLLAVAAFFLRGYADLGTWLSLGAAMVLCFVGSIIWHVEGSPGSLPLGWLTSLALSATLFLGGQSVKDEQQDTRWRAADDLAAGLVLGGATTAMLMGHSYLIAPAMSLTPLFRLIGFLGAALLVRTVLAGTGLWLWTNTPPRPALEGDLLLWLPARWLLGIFGPLILGWMAWETARIRSTQSATGILYVVTIVCFLGELTSQLLLARTGYLL